MPNDSLNRDSSTPSAPCGWNPFAWFSVIGPGAIIASLTIGAGELIFSTRGGALFGYRLLWLILLVLVFKWALVFAAARHIVLTGAHPFERWIDLPGPRGWLPLTFFALAALCFPIWVAFHAGTLGTLVAWLTGTSRLANGSGHFVWGVVLLGGVLWLCLRGGYGALEKVQTVIVLLMLLCVLASLLMIRPDWWEFLKGLLIPQALRYPDWVTPQSFPNIVSRPEWVEAATYVGVIGGSSYDYLAYVSYLRQKGWIRAPANGSSLMGADEAATQTGPPRNEWLRPMALDCAFSFIAVLIFSAVFVTCGAVILAPQHKVPEGVDLLTLQAEFVTPLLPWFRPFYFFGAFLTIAGTLYGTIEVAPTVLGEMTLAFDRRYAERHQARLRRVSILWAGCGGLAVLLGIIAYQVIAGTGSPPALIAILTPANLFTGVLGCGLICWLNLWADDRFMPRSWSMPVLLKLLNVAAGAVLLVIGFKAYWDHSGAKALLILAGTVAVGWVAAARWQRRKASTATPRL